MARQTEIEDATLLSYDQNGKAQDFTTEDDFLKSLLGDTDSTAEILLWRQRTKSHNDGLIRLDSWSGDNCSPTIILEAAERAKRAAGLVGEDVYFRVNIRKNKVLVPGGNQSFCLGAKLTDQLPQVKGADPAMMMMLQQMQADAREFKALMLQQLNAPKPDPMEQMKQTFTMMTLMREAMGLPSAAQMATPAPAQSPLEMMQGMVALFAGMTDAKVKLMEAVGGVGEQREPDTLLTLGREILPGLLATVNREQELRARAPVTIQSGQQAPDVAAPPLKSVPQYVVDVLSNIQKEAEADSDTEEVCNKIFSNPNIVAMLRHIHTLPTPPTPYRRVVDIVPAALDYAFWWSDLLALIEERLDGGASDSDTATPGGGGPDADVAADVSRDSRGGGASTGPADGGATG